MFNVFHEEKETDGYSVVFILTSGYKLQMGLFIIISFWFFFLRILLFLFVVVFEKSSYYVGQI